MYENSRFLKNRSTFCGVNTNFGQQLAPAAYNHLTPIVSKGKHCNECDGVSNHQPHDCLLIHVFRRRSKNMSKLPVTGLCAGNSLVTGEFPAQRPVTQKIFPFDDVLNTFKITTAFPRVTWMNLLTFWKWGWHFKTHCNFQTQFCGHLSCEITFQWVPQNLGDEKLALAMI